MLDSLRLRLLGRRRGRAREERNRGAGREAVAGVGWHTGLCVECEGLDRPGHGKVSMVSMVQHAVGNMVDMPPGARERTTSRQVF